MSILAEIAQARVGYTYRGSLRNARLGEFAVFQMKDVGPLGLQALPNLAKVNVSNLSPHYVLQQGDLIFRSRGLSNQAWVYQHQAERTICIAPLMFIRIFCPKRVHPAYLEWFINLKQTQQQIRKMARGDEIPMIGVADLHKLNIVLPNIERQRKIVEIHQLYQQSQALELQLAQKRLEHTQSSLLQYALAK